MIVSNELRAISSAGFGGIGPAMRRSKFLLTPEGKICSCKSSIVGLSFTRRFVIPCLWSLIPKSSAKRGRRISRPTKITFLPKRPKLTERLAAVKVLPSPEVDDVKSTTFWPSFNINWRLVRIERKISSIWLFLFSWTTISALPFALLLAIATSAIIGNLVRRATSSWPSIL